MSDRYPAQGVTPSNIPIPDPSLITAQEIAKARGELREEYKTAIAVITDKAENALNLTRQVIETRLNAMDTAAQLLSENVNRVPTFLDRESSRLEKLFEEKLTGMQTKFDGIQLQFRERDIRTDQDKIAASTAVNAALQAQKEAAGAQNESNAAAITKSENSFTKEIDGLKSLINTVRDAIQSDVANLTGRLDRGEGITTGGKEMRSEHRLDTGQLIAWIVAGCAILAAIITFETSFHSSALPSTPSAIAVAPLNPSAIAPQR